MDYQLIAFIVTLSGILLAGNGIISTLIMRKLNRTDKIDKLCKINDRQGKELVMLSTTLDAVLEMQELQVDALHEKGVLNGNSVPIKQALSKARKNLYNYTKDMKDKGLFMEVV
jgi:hypothetical protein